MSRLAVIVTAYGPRGEAAIPRIVDALAASTRQPDEVWWMTEAVPQKVEFPVLRNTPTPRNSDGTYALIPYSLKQNVALEGTECDYIAYLTDDSWPAPEKYELMVRALDEHPEWGAVYCAQDFGDGVRSAADVIEDAHCRVDHTQVMHRRTADRWPEEMGDIMVGDAQFWRRLHASLGAFYPVPLTLDYVRQTSDGISAGQRS